MFAASTVEKRSTALRRRSATKKPWLVSTRRPTHRPRPMSPAEYASIRRRVGLKRGSGSRDGRVQETVGFKGAAWKGVSHLPALMSAAAGNPGIPVAARTARTIASAIMSAARAPMVDTEAVPESVPMAKENTVSPSPGV